MTPTVLSPLESVVVRGVFIRSFVDVESERFRRMSDGSKWGGDGISYDGYLWDGLRRFEKLSEVDALRCLRRASSWYVMREPHELPDHEERVWFGIAERSRVLRASPDWIAGALGGLPQDLYVIAEGYGSAVVFTHEYDDLGKSRDCAYCEG